MNRWTERLFGSRPWQAGLHLARRVARLHPVTQGDHPLALLVILPRTASRDLAAIETAMQGLTLGGQSARQPIALELVATAGWRGFMIRASSPAALAHLAEQVRARYPQAQFQPLERAEDPWHISPDEDVTAVELQPGAPSYLPLRSWPERQLTQEGTDPLLGLLAAFGRLPSGTRVIAQLALMSAPDAWPGALQRFAVEHPLEPERARERWQLAQSRETETPGSPGPMVALAALLGLVALWFRTAATLRHTLPPWLWQAGTELLYGRRVALTPAHLAVVGLVLIGAGSATFFAFKLLATVNGRFRAAPLYDMRLVNQKTTPIAYRGRLRLFVIGPSPAASNDGTGERRPEDRLATSRTILQRLTGAYRQFHLAAGSYFIPRTLRRRTARRLLAHPTGWTRGLARSGHLLSVTDVAGLWHLPQARDLADLPLVERTRARHLLAPPQSHLAPMMGLPHLGVSTHAGHEMPIGLPLDAFHRNTLTVAKTGKGKSTLLLHLARAIMEDAGAEALGSPSAPQPGAPGMVLLDPHGDLVTAALGIVPQVRQDDVILVDLADRAYPVGLNPLDVTLGRERDKAVENLLQIFTHIWQPFWGPRMENALEFALKTLYEANEALVAADPQAGPDQQYTLLDVEPLLALPSFRHSLMGKVRDPKLLDWWKHYYERLDERLREQVINPVLTKMAKFSGSQVARRIVGQGRSTLDLHEVVRQGRILLVHTAGSVVGRDTAALVGATLLGLLHVTLAEQAQLPLAARRRVRVLVDEFQSIPGANYAVMLAELRKFGASFILATQALAYLDVLDRTLRPTVLANVDQLFTFATSADDARLLVRELDEAVDVSDLTNLDDFTCYAKLTLQGRRLPVFSLALSPPPIGDPTQAEAIRARSRQRHATPAGAVDETITRALARHTLHPATKEPGAPTSDQEPAVVPNQFARMGQGDRRVRQRGRGANRRRLNDDTSSVGQLSMLLEDQPVDPSLPSVEAPGGAIMRDEADDAHNAQEGAAP
jgi:hypothetical protein